MAKHPVDEKQHHTNHSGAIFTGTMFVAIIALFPLFMDFMVDLSIALGVPREFYAVHAWLPDVTGYVAAFLLMLFYMKTTFEPLSSFGYQWNKDYLGWSVYIGVASGIIIFGVDWLAGLENIYVAPFSLVALLGYILTWGILPALLEETFFRGVIQTLYQKYTHTQFTSHKIHIAVFIAVAFELLFHLSFPIYDSMAGGSMGATILATVPQLLYVAVFGIISGIIYQRTRSLLGPFIIHALGNITELLLIWLFR